jgi:hypothetical protein
MPQASGRSGFFNFDQAYLEDSLSIVLSTPGSVYCQAAKEDCPLAA